MIKNAWYFLFKSLNLTVMFISLWYNHCTLCLIMLWESIRYLHCHLGCPWSDGCNEGSNHIPPTITEQSTWDHVQDKCRPGNLQLSCAAVAKQWLWSEHWNAHRCTIPLVWSTCLRISTETMLQPSLKSLLNLLWNFKEPAAAHTTAEKSKLWLVSVYENRHLGKDLSKI